MIIKESKSVFNIEELTREQKLLFLDVVEEQGRRAREKRAVYKPNSGQLKVHKSEVQLRCAFSGNGAGKTALGVNEALWAAAGYNPITKKFSPVPARIVILLDHPEKVTDVWLPEMRKWANIEPEQLHKRGKPYVTQITWKNGSEFLFMFHQQEPMLFESIEVDYVIADEPPPRHIYISLRRGGRKKGRKPRYLIIGTPITGSWMRTEIYDPWTNDELPDTECFKFGTIVNEANLADNFIKEFSRILSPKERRIRLEGEFFDLEGLALAHLFKYETHVVEQFNWPSHHPVVVAIDPHPQKPHFAVMVGSDEDNYLYYIKEFSAKIVARDFATQLKKWYCGHKVIDIICDSLGSSQYTSGEGFKSFIQVLNEEGVRARATTWDDKRDEDFIDRIKTALALPDKPNNFGDKLPRLTILEGNHGIIKDIENVQWTKYKNLDMYKPKLDITNKDYLSCLKYALASNLTFTKDKAKIYRRNHELKAYGIIDRRGTGYWRKRFSGANYVRHKRR